MSQPSGLFSCKFPGTRAQHTLHTFPRPGHASNADSGLPLDLRMRIRKNRQSRHHPHPCRGGGRDDTESIATVPHAPDRGVTLLDTAGLYGPYANEEPPGRGLLTGAIRSPEEFEADDYRRGSPRLQGGNFRRNLALVDRLRALGWEKSCTPAQLALAWVLAPGGEIVTSRGTRRRERPDENLRALERRLTSADLAAIDAVFPPQIGAGERYPGAMMQRLNG